MSTEYYLIRKRAVPEVLQKVVEVNKLLRSGGARTINDAAHEVGISRSSYYKFKDDIEEFHDSLTGTTLTLALEVHDQAGVLSDLLAVIARYQANILTIHQSIPTGGLATVSISLQVLESTDNVGTMLEELEALQGVRKLRVTGREN